MEKENVSTDTVNTDDNALIQSPNTEYELADSEQVEQTARRILEKYREAFEELAK